ncbi:hypothetical protein [Aliivibrio fischeri]|uniref:hypothetical protein n=1 Tax=Aliivibrio fischeri TaxID=668 RepID=UPI0012DA8DC7|nr:hypothetical protein [Aliivibrio fischeri]MUJ38313.1 hypothetical protein [Aliivibrio fischeri]
MKVKYLLGLLLLSTGAQALQIDTMVKVADKGGSGVFTLVNDTDKASFIKTSISKVNIKENTISYTPYVKDNLKEWEIATTQPKLILDAFRTKNIGVRSLCSESCDNSEDQVYRIKFIPSVYYREGEKQESAVNFNYGYAPIFIIPAKKSNIKYTIENKGTVIRVKNESNTFLQLHINQCTADITTDCSQRLTVLAGRDREFKLLDNSKNQILNISIGNHDLKYYKEKVVNIGKSITG